MAPYNKISISDLDEYPDVCKDYARCVGEELGFSWADRQYLREHERLAPLGYEGFVSYILGPDRPTNPVDALLDEEDMEWARHDLCRDPDDPAWDSHLDLEDGDLGRIIKRNALRAAWVSICYFAGLECQTCPHTATCPMDQPWG